MRKKVELSLNLEAGASTKLDLDAETTDPGRIRVAIGGRSAPCGAESDLGISISSAGTTISVRASGGSTNPRTADVGFAFSDGVTTGKKPNG